MLVSAIRDTQITRILTLIRVISDNRLNDLGAITGNLLERVLWLIPQKLV